MKPVREKLGRILLRRSEPEITYFELEDMRRSLPIQRVAEQPGLRTAGNMIHCWRPENHQHGEPHRICETTAVSQHREVLCMRRARRAKR